jgi:hypothetical protein
MEWNGWVRGFNRGGIINRKQIFPVGFGEITNKIEYSPIVEILHII